MIFNNVIIVDICNKSVLILILRQKICQKIWPGVSFGIFGDFRYNLGFIFKIHALVSLEHCKNDSEIEPFEF